MYNKEKNPLAFPPYIHSSYKNKKYVSYPGSGFKNPLLEFLLAVLYWKSRLTALLFRNPASRFFSPFPSALCREHSLISELINEPVSIVVAGNTYMEKFLRSIARWEKHRFTGNPSEREI